MMSDIFDFGFTTVDEQELEELKVVEQRTGELADNLIECQQRLDKLYNAMQPLLDNLVKNPEKKYILWPDRTDKVDQFRKYLNDIYDGRK